MGKREIHFCDFCSKEFTHPGTSNEPYQMVSIRLDGKRFTTAAGSLDNNSFSLEMHHNCWKRFIQKVQDMNNL